jgi:hypothetical protein
VEQVRSFSRGGPTAMQSDAKKAVAPPPNPNITTKKAALATGSGGFDGCGCIVA